MAEEGKRSYAAAAGEATPQADPREHSVRGELANTRGVKFGRKPKLTEHQKRTVIRRRDWDGGPDREIARSYKCQPQHDFEACGLGSTDV
jgi:hypothetical protein